MAELGLRTNVSWFEFHVFTCFVRAFSERRRWPSGALARQETLATAHGNCPRLQWDTVLTTARAGLSNCTGGVCFGLEDMVSFRDSASLPRTKADQRRETLVDAVEKQPWKAQSLHSWSSSISAKPLIWKEGLDISPCPGNQEATENTEDDGLQNPPPPPWTRVRVLVRTRVPAVHLMSLSYRIGGLPTFWSLTVLWVCMF